MEPFLPGGARVLFLGSFPPPRKRWSMEFFYPNWLNDFWRIMGLLLLGEPTALEKKGTKQFDRERIIRLATEHGLAFFDTAQQVCRTRDNASDQPPKDSGWDHRGQGKRGTAPADGCTEDACCGCLRHLPHRHQGDTMVEDAFHVACLPHEVGEEGGVL